MFIAPFLHSLFALMLAADQLFAGQIDAIPNTWTMYQALPSRNAVFATPNWDARWTVHTGGRIGGGISINGSTIYVESFDKNLYAIDALTGAVRWKAPTPNIAMNTPVIAEGVVVVGTGNNHIMSDSYESYLEGIPQGDYVMAFDASSGRELWRWHTVGEDMPTGAIVLDGARPAFVFSNGDGHVRALELSTGRLLWESKMNGSASMGSIANDGSLSFGTSQTFARFIDANFNDSTAMAHRSWTWAIDASGQYHWIAPYGNQDSSPAVGGGRVYVESTQYAPGEHDPKSTTWRAEVDALDERNGTLLWQFQSPAGPYFRGTSSENSIAGLYDDGIFFESVIYTKSMDAFDARSGKVLWKTPLGGVVKMSAVSYGGYIFFGDSSGTFYVVHRNDGSVVQRISFTRPFDTAPPVIVGATIFIPNGPNLYALPIADIIAGRGPDATPGHVTYNL